jgi:DinB superfamily
MDGSLPAELDALAQALDANERDARQLVEGLTEVQGTWRKEPGSWSVAECLDHLAVGGRVYLAAMEPPAQHARDTGRARRGAARPGLVGGWFARSLEPPVNPRRRMRAPRKIVPRPGPALGDAAAAFFTSHAQVVQFLRTYAGIDLAGVRFPNPFIRGLRFSLATGLHVLAAHERRHLWQAWTVRRGASSEPAGADTIPRAAR